MNIEHFRYVSEIVRCGSFSAAAAKLYISQPTLSAAVKKLEESLGGTLFIRRSTGVVLTPFGESVLPYIHDVVNTINRMPIQTNEKKGHELLRLSVANGGFAYMTTALAQTYNANKERRLSIDCYDVPRERALEMVATGVAQVGGYGIASFQREQLLRRLENKGVSFYPLAVCGPALVVGPKNPLFNREEDWVTLDMIKPYPIMQRLNEHSVALYKYLGLQNSSHSIINCTERGCRSELYDATDVVSISFLGAPYYKIGFASKRRFKLKGVDCSAEIGYIVRKDYELPPMANELVTQIRSLFT